MTPVNGDDRCLSYVKHAIAQSLLKERGNGIFLSTNIKVDWSTEYEYYPQRHGQTGVLRWRIVVLQVVIYTSDARSLHT